MHNVLLTCLIAMGATWVALTQNSDSPPRKSETTLSSTLVHCPIYPVYDDPPENPTATLYYYEDATRDVNNECTAGSGNYGWEAPSKPCPQSCAAGECNDFNPWHSRPVAERSRDPLIRLPTLPRGESTADEFERRVPLFKLGRGEIWSPRAGFRVTRVQKEVALRVVKNGLEVAKIDATLVDATIFYNLANHPTKRDIRRNPTQSIAFGVGVGATMNAGPSDATWTKPGWCEFTDRSGKTYAVTSKLIP